MKLNALKVQNLKRRPKMYKVSDGEGLNLIVNPSGTKVWSHKYRFKGIEKSIGYGDAEYVTLAQARDFRKASQELLAAGIDPMAARKDEKAGRADTFREFAERYLEKYKKEVGVASFKRVQDRLVKWCYSRIGSRPIKSLTVKDIKDLLLVIEARGLLDTRDRTKGDISNVFCYAAGDIEGLVDLTLMLKRGVLVKNKNKKKFAAITAPKTFGMLLRDIDAYHDFGGNPVVELALKISPHVALRPGELRKGRWDHVDFDRAEWRIPGELMKMRVEHVVPLSRQVLALLKQLKGYTGDQALMFPTRHDPNRPMSENTVNACLRRMGYNTKTQHTAHGFRTSFRSAAQDLGWDAAIAEMQLAHAVPGAAGHYARGDIRELRGKMMQKWSDQIDLLRKEGAPAAMRLAA